MPQSQKPRSRQDFLKQQQRSLFVGREDYLSIFRLNVTKPAEDWCFLFNVWGQDGVGKSTLLRQFRKLAEEAHFLTAKTDDIETTVPEVMGRLATQLEQAGHKLENFSECYAAYQQKRREVETDPHAPHFSALLGKSIASKGGSPQSVSQRAVVASLPSGTREIDPLKEWTTYLNQKLSNPQEMRLVQEPVAVLTPLFLQDLGKIADPINLLLIFDGYDRTSGFLDRWLRDILAGRYGDLSLNVMVVIAGRHALARHSWAEYEPALTSIALDPFTEEEAQQYLSRQGIANPQVMEAILRLSGRSPLLLAMLATSHPANLTQINDLSDDVVEQLLQWVEEPSRCQAILNAALPRRLNRDIIALLQVEESADDLFGWLRRMPFVMERPDGWVYHEVAQNLMLRHKQRETPQGWADLHGRLATYFEQQAEALQLGQPDCWHDADWQRYTLYSLYHRLCESPQRQLSKALNQFAVALKHSREFAERWATSFTAAGKAAESVILQQLGASLTKGLQSYADDRYEVAVHEFTNLLQRAELEPQSQAVLLTYRGIAYQLIKQNDKALADFNRAVELEPKEHVATIIQPIAPPPPPPLRDPVAPIDPVAPVELVAPVEYVPEDLLADLDPLIEHEPNSQPAIAQPSANHSIMKQYGNVLQSFERITDVSSYTDMNSHADVNSYSDTAPQSATVDWNSNPPSPPPDPAMAELDRAVELNPRDDRAIANRGEAYRLKEQYDKALPDFDRAIQLDPTNAWAIASRGETHRLMKQYYKALLDFDRAINLNPNYDWAIGNRGQTYRLMERYEQALPDFDRAISLNANYDWAIANRGHTYLITGRHQQALKDFDRAVGLDPQDEEWRYLRALAYLSLHQSSPAKADLDFAVNLVQQKHAEDPDDCPNTFSLALYHLVAGDLAAAKQFYQEALYCNTRSFQIEDAIQNLTDLLKVFPDLAAAKQVKDALEKKLKED